MLTTNEKKEMNSLKPYMCVIALIVVIVSITIPASAFAASDLDSIAGSIRNAMGDVYDMFALIATAVATAVIAFYGIKYKLSGNDQDSQRCLKGIKRTVVGLAIVLVAPLLVVLVKHTVNTWAGSGSAYSEVFGK